MTQLVLIGASCEAEGHPSECTEPAPGTVEQSSAHGLSINGTQVATVASADMNFLSHAHSYTGDPPSCGDNQSHSLDPDAAADSSSLTVNGSPVYIVGSGVTTDPGSGGNVNITDSGGNTSVTESP